MRGGSWNNNRRNARCAYRNRNNPDNFNNNVGFRVVSHDNCHQAGNSCYPCDAGWSQPLAGQCELTPPGGYCQRRLSLAKFPVKRSAHRENGEISQILNLACALW
jgi:hypothetical protein